MKAFKEQWAFFLFAVALLVSLIVIAARGEVVHYKLFTDPSPLLWNHQDPYYVNGVRSGFFYSPSCAMFFFGFFKLFPSHVGVFLYAVLNAFVFLLGLSRVLSIMKESSLLDIRTSPYRHVFWLMVSGELIGGLVAIKIDVLMAGIALLTLSSLIHRRGYLFWSFALGVVTCWKLHPAFVFGLLAIAMASLEFPIVLTFSASFLVGLLFSFLSPSIFLDAPFVLAVSKSWLHALNEYVQIFWLDHIFQHLYGFIARTFQVSIPLSMANKISMVIGAFLCGVIAWYGQVFQRRCPNIPREILIPLVAVGLSSAYVVLFSHMIQSNSYVIYLPIVVCVMVLADLLEWSKKRVLAVLWCAYFIISFVYSDLCPRPIYHMLYNTGVKPLGVLLLAIVTLSGLIELGSPDSSG